MPGTPSTDSEARGSIEVVDQFYRSMANHRRRIAVRVLEERQFVDLETLSEEIAAREPGESDVETIEISLVHQHLPLLEEAGLVEYDSDDGSVTTESAVGEVFPLADPQVQ